MEALISLVITLFTMIIVLGFSLVIMLVVFGFTAFMIWFSLKNGGTIMVSGPLVDLAAAAALQNAGPPPRSNKVKVSTCPTCGGSRKLPSRTAYMYCDYCGQLMDWDFRASMSDKRSRAPGPAYESLLRKHTPALKKAKDVGNNKVYRVLQEELWEAYAKACPAALSPRIGDEEYRKQWVKWTARTQTLQDLHPATIETLEAQTRATEGLEWDRSNPFQPMAKAESFHRLLDAVIAHQKSVNDVIEAENLLDEHPDHPSSDVMRKIGLSAFVQGWLQYVPKAEQDAMLAKTGLEGEYIEPQPVDLTKGECPCCSKPLEVLPDAKRVVCEACGHVVAVKGGTLPCHGCGASIEIPETGTDFNCPHCDAHVARIGLGNR